MMSAAGGIKSSSNHKGNTERASIKSGQKSANKTGNIEKDAGRRESLVAKQEVGSSEYCDGS